MNVQHQTHSLRRGQVTGQHVSERYHDLVKPHVESFDYFLGEGMQRVIEGLLPVQV